MPSQLSECAETLARLYQERAQAISELAILEELLAARQLALTPPAPDGWPGKNEEQRATSRDKVLTADAEYTRIDREARQAKNSLDALEATIDGVKETASALRWEIRAALVAALDKRHTEPAEDAAPSAPEFDSAAQQATDELDF